MICRAVGGPRRSMTRRSSRRRWSRRRRRWRSRTGPAGCWANTSGSVTRRSPGRGAPTGSNPGGKGRSNFSTDPELEAKVRDVVGLYLDRPQNAIVLCVDEKSQIQALNRMQPTLPVRPGLPEKATHDYKRNGTTTLFAALEVATGQITDRCYDRHGKAEFLDFL